MKTNETNSKRKHIINIAIAVAISIVITFMFGGLSGGWITVALNLTYGLLIGLSIAVGCTYISTRLMAGRNWLDNPLKRYLKVFFSIMGFILADVLLINSVWFPLTQDRTLLEVFSSGFFYWLILTEFTIGLVIYLFILSSHFVKHLNQAHLESQKIKEEVNRYKLATLKNQINPHFLFNSLNVLSGMIYKDTAKADDFINRLANIYRYIIDIQDEEVVSLKREVDFAADYLYLLLLRFGENLKYKISVDADGYIVPVSLQILVENSVKHNVITKEKPLMITITSRENTVVVSNNLQPRPGVAKGSETGLENIKARFAFLTDRPVEISSTPKEFVVSLPILKQDK
jgi:sensor histidine kinase YesM